MQIAAESKRLQQQLSKLADHPLTAVRAKLPVAAYRDRIVSAIEGNAVVVVCGETGCGKTTQVPQFILEAMAKRGEGGKCTVVCTQPRRLAAIAVAERIAAERGESVGKTCGYAIRLDAQRSEETRMLFCTTGLLLRWVGMHVPQRTSVYIPRVGLHRVFSIYYKHMQTCTYIHTYIHTYVYIYTLMLCLNSFCFF